MKSATAVIPSAINKKLNFMEQKNKDKNKIDKIGETNIYPVSEMEGASDDAKIHDEATLGQSDKKPKDSSSDVRDKRKKKQ